MNDAAPAGTGTTPPTSQTEPQHNGDPLPAEQLAEATGGPANEHVAPRNVDDADLSSQLEDWMATRFPGDKTGAKRTFIKDEFEARLTSYQKASRYWRAAQISVWSAVVLLGALISIFAAFKTGHGFTIIAGTLVALLTTLTNALHPSQEADGYGDARLALRDQGWSLLNGMGDYADTSKTDDDRYKTFAAAIGQIVNTKRTATKFTLGSPGSAQ
jgi:hypothetical protein